jgi:hypothetical protein
MANVGVQINSLQDLLILRELKNQANPTFSAMQALATGVAGGIAEEQARAKQNKKDAEDFAKFQQIGQRDSTDFNVIQEASFEPGVGIKRKFKIETPGARATRIKTEGELKNLQEFRADVKAGIPADELRTKFPLRVDEIDKLAIAGTIPTITEQQIQQPIITEPTQVGNIIQDGVEFEPSGLDELGRPTGFKPVKPSAAQDKRNVETRELAVQTKNLLGLFLKARKEGEAVPGFGSSGLIGRGANLGAIIKAKAGLSPSINVFQDRIGAFATIAAKAAGEVRPTDQDIVRFGKALTNVKNNDEENALQMEAVLRDIEAKEQGISWAKPFVEEFEKLTGVDVDIDFGGPKTQIATDENGNKAEVEIDSNGNITRVIREISNGF